ncbi:hypothetical protein F2P79_009672 [Pimephales promelas]|nr:hypothetical protein F2P79_009672 [Pimephales promelas]
MREPSAAQDSPDTGCVWSVQSSEAELWDVWADIDCNDGLLLMDRGGPESSPPLHTYSIHSYRGDLAGIEPATSGPDTGCVWSVQSSEAELWDVWTDIDCNDGLLLMDGKSITPAWKFQVTLKTLMICFRCFSSGWS